MNSPQLKKCELEIIEENFSEWSEMGYSLSSYLYELLQKERAENEYLKRRLEKSP